MRYLTLALLAALLVVAPTASAQSTQIAIRGETVHTMAGAPIRDGVVLIRDGKVERVGRASDVPIPKNYEVLAARVVTPGLVDARTVVGLSGALNQPHDQDQLERSNAIQPELRAVDAYNGRETLVAWVRSFGVTTIHTGHAPGALVSGQTMVVKTTAETVDRGVLNPMAMIAVSLGQAGVAPEGRAPGTRPKAVAMLRAELVRAKEYARKMSDADEAKRPPRDLKMDALARVIRKEIPLLVTAHRSHDILAALRIAEEFDVRVVLDGASEAYLVADRIKAAGVPVILHATMQRSSGDAENASFETAAALRKAGIAVALQSGYEPYVPKTRLVLFEAAIAAANGLTFDEALAAITIDAARLVGVADRVGSLEAGKDADVVLFDGDPFEYTTHVTAVVVDGRVVSREVR